MSDLLLVVPNGQLQVSRHDTLFLVVACSIASQLEDLGGKIFEYSSEVYLRPISSSEKTRLRCEAHQVHRSLCVERSCPSSTDGVHDRRGTEAQPWQNAK